MAKFLGNGYTGNFVYVGTYKVILSRYYNFNCKHIPQLLKRPITSSSRIHPVSWWGEVVVKHYVCFLTPPGSKCSANGELLMTTVFGLRLLAPFSPSHSFRVGGTNSDLLISVDWRASKLSWREKPQPVDAWVELQGASALARCARGPLSLRAESPVCTHLQYGHTDAHK